MPSPYSSAATQDDARTLAATLGIRTHELPIESGDGVLSADAPRRVRGRRRRSDRGEPAGPHSRQPADGPLQQVRLARADDGQQVRDVRRLHDPLRRPRGRLRRHQGRAQDARLPAVRMAQLLDRRHRGARSGDRRSNPLLDHRPRPLRRAQARPTRRGLAATIRAARPHPAGLRRAVPEPRAADRARGCPSPRSTVRSGLVDLAEYKRRQAPPGIKITTRAFGRDRRMPITNRYRG